MAAASLLGLSKAPASGCLLIVIHQTALRVEPEPAIGARGRGRQDIVPERAEIVAELRADQTGAANDDGL